jgi:hypothetical protein
MPMRTPSSACESRHRDQRLRKKTDAIFEVFVIMAPATYQKLQGGQWCLRAVPALLSGRQ